MKKQKIDSKSWVKMFFLHRSVGWIPMFNNDPDDKTIEQIEDIIAGLEKITGAQWERNSYFIQCKGVEIVIPVYGEMSSKTKVAKEVRKQFPTVKEECFGYKLEKVKTHKKGFSIYEGIITVSVENILNRGSIIAKEYGV